MKRCALITSLGKIWVHHIIPANQKLMRYEDLKTHIAEVERCQKHTQTKSIPPVFFPENLWENETLQLKPGDRQRGSTTNNIDILTLPPRIFISFAMISNNKLFQNFTRIPGLSLPTSTKKFLQGHMEVNRNAKMSSGRTYNWHSICLDEVISSCSITFFSDNPWKSNTWLSIDGFTCLNQ